MLKRISIQEKDITTLKLVKVPAGTNNQYCKPDNKGKFSVIYQVLK